MNTQFSLKNAPTKGICLIEANAGTGKTFSLSGLFIKFIYQGIFIKNILAITYTKAAAEEIHNRVKKDLGSFVEILEIVDKRGLNDLNIEEYSFAHLITDYAQLATKQKTKIKKHLLKNFYNFDENNIHTIHGFAGKVLLDYSFESNRNFYEKIFEDDTPFFELAFLDFWRNKMMRENIYFLSYFFKNYTIQSFSSMIKTFYQQPALQVYPKVDSPVDFKEEINAFLVAWKNIINSLQKSEKELLKDYQYLENGDILKKNIFKKVLKRWDTLITFFQPEQETALLESYFKDEKSLVFFSYPFIEKCLKKKAILEDKLTPLLNEFFPLLNQLIISINNLFKLFQTHQFWLINQAIDTVRRVGKSHRELANGMNFNDLLINFNNLIDSANHSKESQEENLFKKLGETYQVLLIDEFQDTDPLQCRIFEEIRKWSKAIYYIADPKQSIYGFRQANIHTYFKAREQIPTIYKLLKNYRSDPNLLDAINKLYQRNSLPFLSSELQFIPSQSGLDSSSGSLDFLISPPNNKLTQKQQKQLDLHQMAREIIDLVNQGKFKVSQFTILVRKRSQGFQIHQLLKEYNLPSYMEGVGNVFDTEEALDLFYILKAIIYPRHNSYLRSGVSCKAITPHNIYQQWTYPEEKMNDFMEFFLGLLEVWEGKSFYTMMRKLMREYSVSANLLQQEDGEQRLTNFFHLIDIIHHWGKNKEDDWVLSAPKKILDKLATLIKTEESIENNSLRYEHFLDGIKISTIHKSKGLEYDVVWIPFADENLFKSSKKVIFKPQDHSKDEQVYDIGSEEIEEHRILSQKETMAEELRLLYVSMTRAKKKLSIIITANIKEYPKSPLFYLLHRHLSEKETSLDEILNTTLTNDDFQACIEEISNLKNLSSSIKINFLKPENYSNKTSGTTEKKSFLNKEITFQPFQPFQSQIQSRGLLTSFSSLTKANYHKHHQSQSSNQVANLLKQNLSIDIFSKTDANLQIDPIFKIPANAKTGLFFHTLMENWDFLNEEEQNSDLLTSNLIKLINKTAHYHRYQLKQGDADTIQKMMKKIFSTPIDFPEKSFSFQEISQLSTENIEKTGREKAPNYFLKEMEFQLFFGKPFNQFKEKLFNFLIDAALLPKYYKNDFNSNLIFKDGFVKGFIDLVFQHQGCFYLVDWKSNHLGNQLDDYQNNLLHENMVENGYFLQAYIYLAALHRYLFFRLRENYNYKKHVGGFCYIYMRGLRKGSGYVVGKPKLEEFEKFLEIFD